MQPNLFRIVIIVGVVYINIEIDIYYFYQNFYFFDYIVKNSAVKYNFTYEEEINGNRFTRAKRD